MDGESAASTSAAGASQQLLQRTWGNLIPVKVQLAADNVSSPARPQPLYVSMRASNSGNARAQAARMACVARA